MAHQSNVAKTMNCGFDCSIDASWDSSTQDCFTSGMLTPRASTASPVNMRNTHDRIAGVEARSDPHKASTVRPTATRVWHRLLMHARRTAKVKRNRRPRHLAMSNCEMNTQLFSSDMQSCCRPLGACMRHIKPNVRRQWSLKRALLPCSGTFAI